MQECAWGCSAGPGCALLGGEGGSPGRLLWVLGHPVGFGEVVPGWLVSSWG